MLIDAWSQSAGGLASTIKAMTDSPRFSGAKFKPMAGWLQATFLIGESTVGLVMIRHCPRVTTMLVFEGYGSKMVVRLLALQSQESTITKMTGAAEDDGLVRFRDMRPWHVVSI